MRGFAALGAGELVARVIAFGVSVYLSRTLLADGYGLIAFSLAVLLYLQRIVMWDLEPVGVHEVLDDDDEARRVVVGLIWYRVLIAVALVALTTAVSYLALPDPDWRVLSLYALSLVALGTNIRFAMLMRRRAGVAAAARVAGELVAAAVILGLVHQPRDVVWVPIATIVAEIVATGTILGAERRRGSALVAGVRVRVSDALAAAKPVMLRAVPLVAYGLLGLVTFNVDLLMLRFMWGTEPAGYYAAAYAIVSLIVNLGFAYYANVVPTFTRFRNDRGALEVLYREALAPALICVLPLVVGGILVAPTLIETVFGERYQPSITPLRPLLVAAGLTVLRAVQLAALVATGHRQRALMMNVIGAAVNIGFNFLLIPRYGILGAALSTVLTDIIRIVVAARFVRDAGFAPLGGVIPWRTLLATGGMAAVVAVVADWPLFVSIPIGGLSFVALLVAVGGVRRTAEGRLRLVA